MPTISLVARSGFSNEMLADAAGREGMVGDDGRLRRHHQREIGLENSLAVERAELAAGIAADAEAVLAADIERQLALEPALVGLEEADHAAEMVVMAVAQHHGVEQRRIDLEDRHVVEQRFRRIAEVDEQMAGLVAALGLRIHGEAPFAVEHRARRRVGMGVAVVALDGQAIALRGPARTGR